MADTANFQVELIEKELVTVELKVLDIVNQEGTTEVSDFVYNEIPTKINSKRFQTCGNFNSETLRVFLNGIKEKEITIISSNIFEFKIDIIEDDTIEVNYIKA